MLITKLLSTILIYFYIYIYVRTIEKNTFRQKINDPEYLTTEHRFIFEPGETFIKIIVKACSKIERWLIRSMIQNLCFLNEEHRLLNKAKFNLLKYAIECPSTTHHFICND